MSCQYGSQKKQGASDFINTNQIGSLCFALGAEGNLCRLLDLIPELIEKVKLRNFSSNDTLNILEKMLKKVAKRTVGLIWDEITGQIDVSQFCQNPAPPLPEDITYYDVFQFFGSVVPILGYFFEVNDILIGNETKLLDKVVGFWLYQKWFENCECKLRDDTPYKAPKPLPKFPFNSGCPAIDNNVPALNARIAFFDQRNELLFSIAAEDNVRNFSYEQSEINRFITGYAAIGVELRNIRQEVLYTSTSGTVEVFDSSFGCLQLYAKTLYKSPDSWNVVVDMFGGGYNGEALTIAIHSIVYPQELSYRVDSSSCNCPPITRIKPPKIFCDLFPDEPLCQLVYGCTDPTASNYNPDADTDDGSCLYCNVVSVNIVEFAGCNSNRLTKTVQLYNSGDLIDISVVEFDFCGGDRQSKTVQLYNCSPSQPVYGCTDPAASNYNPDADTDDGSCLYSPYGCTDPAASNYNPRATIDDGSCVYPFFECYQLESFFTELAIRDVQDCLGNGFDVFQGLEDKLNELASTQEYVDHPDCVNDFNMFYSQAWWSVIYPQS